MFYQEDLLLAADRHPYRSTCGPVARGLSFRLSKLGFLLVTRLGTTYAV